MFAAAMAFLIVAIISGVLGFGVVAGTAANVAKVLFYLFMLAFAYQFVRRRRTLF